MEKRGWQRALGAGIVIVLLFVGVYGCKNLLSYRTVREREPEVKQPISTSYRFEDIPLPPGMTLNRKESFIYETRATKTGLLIYEGRGEMEKLSNFFKQQMPKYEWRLVSNFELHNVMLTFIKEGWSSIIYILPQEGEMRRLEIRVGPIEIKILPPSKE
ncbi:MAG: hypothetical protein Q8O03_08310 [Nanoarchaeota archaeon]|nr:hypothetical protein [Nanoarchaeota archaeon]